MPKKKKKKNTKTADRCKYCGTGHAPSQCPTYGKSVVTTDKRIISRWFISQYISSSKISMAEEQSKR